MRINTDMRVKWHGFVSFHSVRCVKSELHELGKYEYNEQANASGIQFKAQQDEARTEENTTKPKTKSVDN